MRSIWTGSISFGLINIPVKLYSAVESSTLNLDMLDSKDHSNIKFKRVNENTGKEVQYANIVKGYKYNDDYVVLDKEDFENADAKKTKMIEILHFVKESEIDSIYYEQPYFLEPEKNAEKAYAILRDALKATGKVGVTSFVMRNREGLAIVKPYGKAILLNRIRFQEEIRSEEELKLPPATKIKAREQEMATKLIDQLTEKFDISQYKDTYTEKLLKIIKAKAKGVKVKPAKLRVVHSASKDLMSMLKASLDAKPKRKAS